MSKKNKNYDYFLVQGKSMLPILKSNQKIKILKTKDVRVGDIIVFKGKVDFRKNKSSRIVHRIIKIGRSKIITKGDNQYSCDRPFTYKEILGKVIKVGNKRIDNSYYNFINPFIAKMSYFSMKINPMNYKEFRFFYNHLRKLKIKFISNKNFYISSFLNLPHWINYKIFKLLKK